jgi:ATP-binding cassette subfamily B protein
MDYFRKANIKFFKLLNLEKRDVFSIYFYAIVSGIIYLTLPLGIQSIINNLFGNTFNTSIFLMIVFVLFGVFANGYLNIIQLKLTERIQRRIFARFSMEFAYKLPRLELDTISNIYLPELMNRFFDIGTLQKTLSKILITIPSAIIQMFFGLILISIYHPFFIIFSFIVLIVLVLIILATSNAALKNSIKESDEKYKVAFWLEEIARILKSLKLSSSSDFPLKKTDDLVCSYLDAREKHFSVILIQSWAFLGFKFIITFLLLSLGVFLVINQDISIGQFVASEIIILMILNSVEKIVLNLENVYDMLTAIEKITKIFDYKEEDIIGSINTIQKIDSIEVKDLTFSYNEDDNTILENLSFKLEVPKKLCVMGTQGSGKSTLLSLLIGIYNTNKKDILVNDMPMSVYNIEEYRKKLGIYFDNQDIFEGTLLENITLNREADTNLVIKLIKEIGLLDYFQTLTDGFRHKLVPFGKKLPTSVIKKILLCRAMFNQPDVVLLEDYWYNLEPNEQTKQLDYLFSQHNTSIIATTNDLEFAKRADNILFLHDKKIMFIGNYQEMIQNKEIMNLISNISL